MRRRILNRLPRVAWAAAAGRPLAKLDLGVLRFLRTHGHQAPVETAMRGLGWAGEWGAIWSASALAAAAGDPRRRPRWLAATVLPPVAIVANYGFKRAINRERPVIEELPALGYAASSLSFPSAHATSSVAAATAIARISPASRPVVYTLAALVCVGRPYLGMHYPSDVLVGVALGRIIGRLAPGLDEPAESPPTTAPPPTQR
ncbi:MAG TPA: phosphatase PAP2 family protein [Solirubrobacterales bacterium]